MTPLSARRDLSGNSHLSIYFKDIDGTPLLSHREERDLALRIQGGDMRARDHMVRANLRLVVNIARGYLNKGMSLEDLIEEGNLGLLRAVEGFDGGMETRFSTYAGHWIKQSIRRAVMNNGKPIRLPAYMVLLLGKWKRASTILADRLGRPATPEEIGKALKLSKKKVGIVAKAIHANSLRPHQEGPGEDDGPTLEGGLTDGRTRSPVDLMVEADDLERIFDRIDELDEREADVLRMRFGLEPYERTPLREVGERLGLTRSSVLRLERRALLRLIAAVGDDEGRIKDRSRSALATRRDRRERSIRRT